MFRHTMLAHAFHKNINWKKLLETPTKKAGAVVRRIAINSIKSVSYQRWNKQLNAYQIYTRQGYSKPFGAPWSRSPGHPMKRIFSVPEAFALSVGPKNVVGSSRYVVGTESFRTKSRGTPTPGIHEHGGRVPRSIPTKKGGRRFIMAKYPKRPFMSPALHKARSKIASIWHQVR